MSPLCSYAIRPQASLPPPVCVIIDTDRLAPDRKPVRMSHLRKNTSSLLPAVYLTLACDTMDSFGPLRHCSHHSPGYAYIFSRKISRSQLIEKSMQDNAYSLLASTTTNGHTPHERMTLDTAYRPTFPTGPTTLFFSIRLTARFPSSCPR